MTLTEVHSPNVLPVSALTVGADVPKGWTGKPFTNSQQITQSY